MQFVKTLHITLALISVCGFSARVWAMLYRPELLQLSMTRRLPHIVDTLLLASGVSLAWHYSFNPIYQPWLATKLVLLVCYILLGAFGLRYAHTRQWRLTCSLAALGCAATILYLAHYKPLLYGA